MEGEATSKAMGKVKSNQWKYDEYVSNVKLVASDYNYTKAMVLVV